MTRTSLQDKVKGLLDSDDGTPIFEGCWAKPNRRLSEFENELRDWGMYYGITFAVARAEDPFEPITSVAERALVAAYPLFREYGGFSGREPAGALTQ